jgi:hypothetical protein
VEALYAVADEFEAVGDEEAARLTRANLPEISADTDAQADDVDRALLEATAAAREGRTDEVERYFALAVRLAEQQFFPGFRAQKLALVAEA